MLPPVLEAALLQAAVVIILCVGFTFTYMMEKFPNFAHTAIATIGTVVSFTAVTLYGLSPYEAIPLSALACGVLGMVLYLIIVRPLRKRGAHVITLTFAFFTIAIVISSFVDMYSYWYIIALKSATEGFPLTRFDFVFLDAPGVFWVSLITDAVLLVFLWFFLSRSRLGTALRAVAEDEHLASNMGINTNRIHLISWFITGTLVGLAGAIIPLWTTTSLDYSDALLVIVMAGSVVGGLNSVGGAVLGGSTSCRRTYVPLRPCGLAVVSRGSTTVVASRSSVASPEHAVLVVSPVSVTGSCAKTFAIWLAKRRAKTLWSGIRNRWRS